MTGPQTLRLLLTIAAIIFVIDRLTKWIVVEAMDLANAQRIQIADPFLNFVMAWNTGINFGIGGGDSDVQKWFLVVLSLAIAAALIAWSMRRGESWLAIGSGIVVGGAVGNAWDRVQYGAVADFLNMSCCGIENPYAFNVADIAIFAGALLIALKA